MRRRRASAHLLRRSPLVGEWQIKRRHNKNRLNSHTPRATLDNYIVASPVHLFAPFSCLAASEDVTYKTQNSLFLFLLLYLLLLTYLLLTDCNCKRGSRNYSPARCAARARAPTTTTMRRGEQVSTNAVALAPAPALDERHSLTHTHLCLCPFMAMGQWERVRRGTPRPHGPALVLNFPPPPGSWSP
eukprot:scaffold47388_cov38-Tisochrysis_lutea.AAC.3